MMPQSIHEVSTGIHANKGISANALSTCFLLTHSRAYPVTYNQRDMLITPFLVKEDKEDDVIAQAGNAMGRWHVYGKGKDIVDERIEHLINE